MRLPARPRRPPSRGPAPRRCVLVALAAAALAGCDTFEVSGPGIHAWQVDSMVKVFEDTRPPREPPPVTLDAARNEVVSAQYAVRSGAALKGLRCRVRAPMGPGGVSIEGVRVRFVGFVPVERNSDGSAIRRAPARFPDPLLEAPFCDVPARRTQPVWLTLHVPRTAPPGRYVGAVVFYTIDRQAVLPLSLRVHRAVLPEARTLWVSNWLHTPAPSRVKPYTDFAWSTAEPRYWALLRRFARNMAAHRQSAILTPLFRLIRVGADSEGRLAFDFALFDRWVELFQDAGVVGRIEGGHLAHGPYGTTEHHAFVWRVRDGEAVRRRVGAWSDQHEAFLAAFLPALQAHLAERGWLDAYVQHLMDEPTEKNYECYRKLAAMVAAHGPKLKVIDALRYRKLAGSVDVWVPQINHFAKWLAFFQGRQDRGEEVWFYTCLGPRRPYMNRFIDYPLLKVRLLHWANARYGATGYLHWGWNYWTTDPFGNVEDQGQFRLPPGDSYIVYPKRNGVLDSIRYEAMLEGIQDYELLRLLAARRPGRAGRIMAAVVSGFRRYELDPDAFRAARRELLEALSGRPSGTQDSRPLAMRMMRARRSGAPSAMSRRSRSAG